MRKSLLTSLILPLTILTFASNYPKTFSYAQQVKPLQEIKIGDPMPEPTGEFLGLDLQERVMTVIYGIPRKRFTNIENYGVCPDRISANPFALYDNEKNIVYLDNKMSNGVPGSDRIIDEIKKMIGPVNTEKAPDCPTIP